MDKVQVKDNFHNYFSRLIKAGRQPVSSVVRLIGRIKPELLFYNHSRLAKRQGFKRSYFILSFDCDTNRDIEVVESIHARIGKIGIIPVYAVPGQLLERGKDVYSRIAATGVEFINHGYYQHTHYNPQENTYESSYFYHQLPHEMILEDIQRGHETHLSILGKKPAGFRVPHFGTFQRKEHLEFLHGTLRGMGYKYSTSTSPLYGFLHGPVSERRNRIYEIPLSGCFDMPLAMLDSWGFRYAPNRKMGEEDYARQFTKLVNYFQGEGNYGLINCYVDPSQVYDWGEFFEMMKLVTPLAVSSYERILKEIRKWQKY
jgi:hypothetical protein